MKRQLITLFLTLGSVCTFGTKLQAQSYRIGSTVPFAFHVGNTSLESGRYQFSRQGMENFDMLRNAETGSSLILGAGPAQLSARGPARLVFHKYGDQYFLREVWNGLGTGKSLPESKLEKEVRSEQTGLQMTSTTIYLASLR